jgi:hypothetical protein
MSAYKIDPWHEGGFGERFYQDAFVGGVCKYCGSPDKSGPLALCECSGLVLARHALKMKLYGAPAPTAPTYQPDAHIEPKGAWEPDPETPL